MEKSKVQKICMHESYGDSAGFYFTSFIDNIYVQKSVNFSIISNINGDIRSFGYEKIFNLIKEYRHKNDDRNIEILCKTVGDNKTIKAFALYKHSDGYDTIMEISIFSSEISIVYSGHYEPDIQTIKKEIAVLIREKIKPTDKKTCVQFSYNTPRGPGNFSRSLECPGWSSLENNYPSINKEINWLINEGENDKNGSLIIWSGITGTGKTYALRSLVNHWKKTQFIVLLDPEQFMDSSQNIASLIASDILAPDDDDNDTEYKYNCVIMEDAPDFILTESRGTKGDLVSKMLNITSGIMGQGLNLKFIITTNENIRDVDPAFMRSGRLLQRLEFPLFTQKQATDWLKQNNKNYEKNIKDPSLADLYGILNKVHRYEQKDKTNMLLKCSAKGQHNEE